MLYQFEINQTYKITETVEVEIEADTLEEAKEKISEHDYKRRLTMKREQVDPVEKLTYRDITEYGAA